MTYAGMINLFLFVCNGIYTCVCHWSPRMMVRLNSQPFAPQVGRSIGQQSQHFQNLMWHIYHDSKIDRYIHISTIIVDTPIWILFICFYFPFWIEILIVLFLISQSISKGVIFPRSIIENCETNLKENDTPSETTIECIHCDLEHAYPNELYHLYFWIKMRWFRVETYSLKMNWKEHHISLCSSLFWIFLVSTMHYLLNKNYINSSHLTILHIIIPINAFLRTLGHILERIPPFIDENEHFLDDYGYSFLIGLLRRGLICPLIRLMLIAFISEYQAGQLFVLPQFFLHELFARILRPLEEKFAKEHYRYQAETIRREGWKSTVLTKAMFKPFFKTH